MKKVLAIVSVILLFSLITPTSAISSEEFAANEAYYRELCTGILENEDRATCTSFQEYLNQKIEGTKDSINELTTQIEAVKNDLAQADTLLRQQQIEIENAQAEMVYLEEQIVILEQNIKQLMADIEVRIQEIARVDKQIKSRVVAQQSNLHVNSMVNFVFGGQSYLDVVRRAEVADKLSEQDKDQMEWFKEEKIQLENDQVELEHQQGVLEVSLTNVTALKETLEIAKAENERTIAAYQAEVAALNDKQAQLQAAQSASENDISTIKAQFTDLDNREARLREEAERLAREAEEARRREEEARAAADAAAAEAARQEAEAKEQESQDKTNEADQVASENGSDIFVTGSGWSLPVYGSQITAGAWYYGGGFAGIFGGGVHYGVDFGAPVGTPIYSTGPGVVIRADGGCPTWGYLGNPCGSYGGNQVYLALSMNNSTYVLTYAHMASISVNVGDIVGAGTQIGTVGSSGNSSGPHLHHEIYYIGDMSVNGFISSWNGSFSFTPTGEWMNLNWTCENRGGPPCRINPQTWYGVEVGVTY